MKTLLALALGCSSLVTLVASPAFAADPYSCVDKAGRSLTYNDASVYFEGLDDKGLVAAVGSEPQPLKACLPTRELDCFVDEDCCSKHCDWDGVTLDPPGKCVDQLPPHSRR